MIVARVLMPIMLFVLMISFNASASNNQANNQANNQVWLFSTASSHSKFYNQSYLSNWDIKHYIVDSIRQLEQQLSQGLSSDLETAKIQIRKIINADKTQLSAQAKQAYQGVVNAQTLGIKKIPAITFDKGKTVIYGEFDLLAAYRAYRQ